MFLGFSDVGYVYFRIMSENLKILPSHYISDAIANHGYSFLVKVIIRMNKLVEISNLKI